MGLRGPLGGWEMGRGVHAGAGVGVGVWARASCVKLCLLKAMRLWARESSARRTLHAFVALVASARPIEALAVARAPIRALDRAVGGGVAHGADASKLGGAPSVARAVVRTEVGAALSRVALEADAATTVAHTISTASSAARLRYLPARGATKARVACALPLGADTIAVAIRWTTLCEVLLEGESDTARAREARGAGARPVSAAA